MHLGVGVGLRCGGGGMGAGRLARGEHLAEHDRGKHVDEGGAHLLVAG